MTSTDNVVPFPRTNGTTPGDLAAVLPILRPAGRWVLNTERDGATPWIAAEHPVHGCWFIGREDGAFVAGSSDHPEARLEGRGTVSLGRFRRAEDAARAILQLCVDVSAA